MNKKVLVGTDVMGRGGVDTYTIQLVRKALVQGWQVEVVVDTSTASSIPKTLAPLCPIHSGPLYHRHYDPATLEAFFSHLLHQTNPALVHLSCGIPWSCLAARKATLTSKIPLLFTEHYIPPDLSFSADILASITQIYAATDRIIHVSEENLRLLLSHLPSPPLKTPSIIPNGIDLERLLKRARSASNRVSGLQSLSTLGGKYRFLSASRFTHQKGIDLLLQAVELLEEERQRFTLDIWGEGPEFLTLQAWVARNKLGSTIHFYPWTPAILDLFYSYDLFIFPSRSEGLPFTLLEALASGIPVVTSDIAVHRWMTDGGKYGALFKNGNAHDLSLTLKEWIENPLAHHSLSTSIGCLQWLKEHFDQNKNLFKTLKIWHQLAYV